MKKYQTLELHLIEIKRKILLTLIIALIIQVLILAIGSYAQIKAENRSYNPFETCFYGMDQIFSHNPSTDLIHSKVIEDLKDHKFEVEKVTLVKLLDGLNCDVIAKDTKGFRSYRVSLEKNTKFPHLYRILNINGQKIKSRYQWER